MNRYVVATAAVILLAAASVAVTFALRGGENDASSAGPVPSGTTAPSVSTRTSTTAGSRATDTNETGTAMTEANTAARAAPCSSQTFVPVLKRGMERADYRIVRARVGRCRNGYAQVFAVPDQSACPSAPCLETEQVFLGRRDRRWRILFTGTGITCEDGRTETDLKVRHVCEALGWPQALLLTTRTFRTPSGNIGCELASRVLRCDILSGLNPEPSRPCELDWVGVVLPAAGAARPDCAGDTVYEQAASTLAYGAIWARGRFRCDSDESGLSCVAMYGAGTFTLAREAWTAS